MSFIVNTQHSEQSFPCPSGESILEAGLSAGIDLPHACRSGSCGSCIALLTSGHVEELQPQDALLDSERNQGKILMCSCSAAEDVSVCVEGLDPPKNQFVMPAIVQLPVKVSKLEKLSEEVMLVELQLPPNKPFDFLPGQYIDIVLKDNKKRSFSIANSDSKKGLIELHVGLIENGRFTSRVFNSLRAKDILRIQGPYGRFILKPQINTPLLFIAGGTGFAPIKGILEQAFANKYAEQIILYWGVRTQQDAYLLALVESWASQYPNFSYHMVYSREVPEGSEQQPEYAAQRILREHTDISSFNIYASGPPALIDDIAVELKPIGLRNDNYYFDAFEFAADAQAGINQLKNQS